jgi:hypothetical protein
MFLLASKLRTIYPHCTFTNAKQRWTRDKGNDH